MNPAFEWFVGIDWASRAHEVCILSRSGQLVERFSVRHSGQGLTELVEKLSAVAAGQLDQLAVAIEVPHGAVVETLLEKGLAVFSLNPKQADRFRDRFSPAGAKDDRRDAQVLASALRSDPESFRRLQAQPEQIVLLHELVRIDQELSQEHRRLANQLLAQLQRFYPQLLSFSPAADEPWVWQLLRRAPTPADGRRLQEKTLAQLLAAHRIRRFSAAELRQALQERPLVVAAGTTQAASQHIQLLLDRLELVHQQQGQVEKRTRQLLAELAELAEPRGREHRDVTILRSLPGIGWKISATMLAQAYEALSQADYHALRLRGGLAPVTVASGKSRQVRMRRACDQRLSGALHHMAANAAIHDPVAKEHYRHLRAAGHSHNRALRGVADRQLRILCAMLRDGTLYDACRNQRSPYRASQAA